jgi:hypothetical protein
MPLVVALVLVVGFVFVLWFAMGRDPGPSAVDAAVSYALARARGDWGSVFDLSGTELRSGRDRHQFVAAHRGGGDGDDADSHDAHAADPHARVEQSTVLAEVAVVVVHVDDTDVALRLDCEKRNSRWVVTSAAPA